ncbi:sodium-dependent transporter [Clostridium sp. Cult2]|uniref:sodium-dependent transporter n=1 Tax=Clostridium sp. Cult2 TaxID=2079003 RepID=UPI001F4528BD|nr:sodium-dependent transporter [Clostridium sp. Cult2]MCF6464439.1 sodium-dependent transporter [Clostridium sp. Cult2]
MESTKTESINQQSRESWGSRFGFIMATAGFSIGLGNIWRFPYLVGMNGGGAFLLVYIVICVLICIPLFLQELSLGRKSQLEPVTGMRKVSKKGSIWVLIGWFGSIAALLIMSYYIMLIGWIFAYFVKMVLGEFNGATANDIVNIYVNFTSNPLKVLMYIIPPAIILGIIVTRGLQQGVEKASKIMMPALFLMLGFLAIRSITLPGAIEGLKWYLTPDISKINGSTILAALGQAFFSVGIGMAAGFTYGSYLKPESDLPSDGITVIFFDTLIAFTAGLVIFPALFAFDISPEVGPSLIFKTMPYLFLHVPAGNFFGSLFFFLLVIAAFTTGMAYIETLSATMSALWKIEKKKAVWILIVVIIILAIPSVLSQGPWSHILIINKDIFDFTDYISGNIILTAGALLLSIYTAKVWKFEGFREETNIGAKKFMIPMWWKPFVVYLIPIAVAIILITGMF